MLLIALALAQSTTNCHTTLLGHVQCTHTPAPPAIAPVDYSGFAALGRVIREGNERRRAAREANARAQADHARAVTDAQLDQKLMTLVINGACPAAVDLALKERGFAKATEVANYCKASALPK